MSLEDQAQAAVAETRRNVASALGVPAEPSPRGTSPIFEEFWERFAHAPRCAHLRARPIQPSHLLPWHGVWMCGPCAGEFSVAARGSLNPIEEFTCDRCRRYSTSIEPAVIRQDFWVITAGFCARCAEALLDGGGRRLGGEP